MQQLQHRILGMLSQIKNKWLGLSKGTQIRFMAAALVLALAIGFVLKVSDIQSYENEIAFYGGEIPEAEEKRAKQTLAKQTEIEKSIMMLENVEYVQVILNIAGQSSAILRDEDAPSASVIIKTSAEPKENEIEAIANHVSKSVQNLKLENVSIMDTNENSLF